MILNILREFLLETYRLFVEISPYLIIGFFFAGLLHTLLGEKYIKKHFARSGLWSMIKAAAFGVPLPVCSCGVIPLAEAMRRDGASRSSTMTFLVSTPSSGVDSILATYALMGPIFAIFRPIASFLSGIMVGVVTHAAGGKDENDDLTLKQSESDGQGNTNNKSLPKKSIGQVFCYGFEVIPAEIARWLIIGVIIGGAIASLVPDDFGSRYLHNPLLSYVMVLLISIPIYVCATGSIPIAASLITKGVLPGAALAFLIAGPATNTVTISFVYKRMGKRITALYILSIIIVSVATGLIFDWIWRHSPGDMGFITAGDRFIPHALKILSAVALLLIIINSKYNLRRFRKVSKQNLYKIKIPDMTCQHCKMRISEALQSIPGVKSVFIDLNNKEVTVEGAVDKNLILERIREEGYTPEE
ncbi:MAG: SO_0444 family Cu/Zn efflux transporter [Candidatus Aminicenantes bacterium]|nr:SO_0444 family Cu/Zn efflux transporter [Candidatus Aminicenantes bacterium]